MNEASMRIVLTLVVCIFALTGCNGETVYPVSGSVEYLGQPVPAGQIFFDPDPAKGTPGPQGFAVIKEGRFDTKQNGRGISGGGYIVRIEGFDGQPGEEMPLGKALFPSFEEPRDLPRAASEQQFTVSKR
jgi:hypothetical protein